MFDNYKSYYTDGLLPAYHAYAKTLTSNTGGQLSLRGPAFQAANMLFHFRDYLVPVIGESFTRNHVGNLCSSYNVVGDVFNLSKHASIIRKNPTVRNTNSVKEVLYLNAVPKKDDPQALDYVYSQWKLVVFRLKMPKIDFLEECTTVVNFWADFLQTNNLLNQVYHFNYKGDDLQDKDFDDRKGKAVYLKDVNNNEPEFLVQTRQFNFATNHWDDIDGKATTTINDVQSPLKPFFPPR